MYQAGHMESGHSPVSRIQLDAKDTVITQLSHFIQGVKDACRFPVVFRQIQQDARVRSNVVRASVIQLLLLLSVLALEFIVSSLTRRGLEDSHKGKLSWYFEVLWLYPLLALSYLLQNPKTADDALQADTRPSLTRTSSSTTINVRIFDGLARSLVIITCFVISFLLYKIWLVGRILCFFFLCIIDGYYCFEYIWTSRGWDLKEKAKFLEERWPYFAGFGLPCTIISFFHRSPVVNLALFSLTYPINLLLAGIARPVPGGESQSDLFNNSDSSKQPQYWQYWPKRLPVLWIAVQLNDLIHHPSVRRMFGNRSTSGFKKASSPQPSPSGMGHSAPASYGFQHSGTYTPSQPSAYLRPQSNTSNYAQQRQQYKRPDVATGSAASVATRPSYAQYGSSSTVARRTTGSRPE